jgi:hypothetical protein
MESEFGDNDGLDDFEPGAYSGTVLVHDEEDDVPGRRHGELIPRFDAPIDLEGEFDSDEVVQFFELVAEGYGFFEISVSLAWSKYQLERFLADPERSAIIEMLAERRHDQVERALHNAARAGNPTAIRTWLFCQARHRGWSDTRKIQIEAESRTEIVISVREAMTEVMAQAKTPEQVAAIQAAFLDDDDIVDADVV